MMNLSRRAALAGAACLPVLLLKSPANLPVVDPKAPSSIRWPIWMGGEKAGAIMTPAELAARYSDPRKQRYALRRRARYQAETGRAVS